MKFFKHVSIALVSTSVLALTACSSNIKPVSQSVNSIKGNPNAVYAPAVNSDKVQTKVVHQYVPVPVAGQLMETPSSTQSVSINSPKTQHSQAVITKPTAQSDQQLVQQANKKATRNPKIHSFFNAMMTYNYMPGAMYTVYCAPLRLTDVALQQGEKIISIAAGDTLRWQISQTYSGQGSTLRQHVILKPNSSDLHNSVLITTNRRVYHLVLVSTKNNTYMVSVNWHYENSPLTFVSNESQGYGNGMPGSSAATTGSPFQLDLARLNFNYEFGMLKGNKPSWYPTRIFNDGRQTFIEFPKHFYRTNLPVLYVAGNDHKYGTMVNWRLKGRYMIVDTVLTKARLQTGVKSKKDQTIIQIQNT